MIRLFVGDVPETGSHPGYRGSDLRADAAGVIVPAGSEILTGDLEDFNGVWEKTETRVLIPWHRIDCLEWD